jgi:hypothetical protein
MLEEIGLLRGYTYKRTSGLLQSWHLTSSIGSAAPRNAELPRSISSEVLPEWWTSKRCC